MTVILNEETISLYKTYITDPLKHGLAIRSLNDVFEASEIVTAKHELAEAYINELKPLPLPKAVLYIIMDQLYGPAREKDPSGLYGYKLKYIDPCKK